MKICWLVALLPLVAWPLEPDDSVTVINDVRDPLYETLVKSITTLQEEVDTSITQFEKTVTMQRNRIRELNGLLEQADTRTRRLTLATCLLSITTAALIAREAMRR